jgi:hypothetical protein
MCEDILSAGESVTEAKVFTECASARGKVSGGRQCVY